MLLLLSKSKIKKEKIKLKIKYRKMGKIKENQKKNIIESSPLFTTLTL